MSIKDWLRRWLNKDDGLAVIGGIALPESQANAVRKGARTACVQDDQAQSRFSIVRASNGLIVEQGRYIPNSRGPDWTFTMHIVMPDERVSDVIARLLVIERLEGK